jgi:uncharacterized protein YcbK (DUF882 family)
MRSSGSSKPTRRHFLIGGAALALAGGLARPASAGVSETARRLAFHNLHTGDTLDTAYWHGGEYDQAALDEIAFVLRDHRSGEIKPMDRMLLDLLHRLQGALDVDEPYQIISGYRSPKTNAKLAAASGGVAKRSLHMKGMAVDVRLASRDIGQIRRAARSLKAGGVGYYAKSNFVHLDVGRVRAW